MNDSLHRVWLLLFTVITGLSFSQHTQADDLLMIRVNQTFPEAMVTLQTEIKNHGYVVSRVQRVDIGLSKSGFKTDKYRVVFFGKTDELAYIVEHNPELIPYLPLKISIFAEESDTIMVTTSPRQLGTFFGEDTRHYFDRWSVDINKIFDAIRQSE